MSSTDSRSDVRETQRDPEEFLDAPASESSGSASRLSRYLRTLLHTRDLSTLWPFIRPEWRHIVRAVIVVLLLTAAEVATPLLIGEFVDSLITDLEPTTSAASTPLLSRRWTLGLLLIAAVSRGLLLAQQRALAGRIGEHVARRIRNRLWSHIQHLPIDYSRRRGPGRMILRFISDTRAVQRLVTDGLVRLSQELLLAAAILGALLFLNVRMALAVIAILPLYGAIFWRLNPQLRRQSRARRRRRSRVSGYLHERISGMSVVKGYAQQEYEQQRFKNLNRKLARRGERVETVRGRVEGLGATAVAVSGVLVLTLAAGEVNAGRLTGGQLVAFYTLLGLLTPIFQRIVQANRYFQEAHISVDRLRSTLSQEPEQPRGSDLPELEVTEGEISVESVSYTYEPRRGSPQQPALFDVSLSARRGELVAIVGPNGSGKSTLLDLLLSFRLPTSGRITIDGQDLTSVSIGSLRSRIGSVTQDSLLFDGTIYENIAYAVPHDASEQEVERAASLAGLDGMIDEMEDGWDTTVGLEGRELSGGQRQRVALARALAHDPPLLMLDEATSALDAEAEQEVAERLRMIARDKTVIVVAHRLPTLEVADRIYVLNEGRVVENGTHHTLLSDDNVYSRLFGNNGSPDNVELR